MKIVQIPFGQASGWTLAGLIMSCVVMQNACIDEDRAAFVDTGTPTPYVDTATAASSETRAVDAVGAFAPHRGIPAATADLVSPFIPSPTSMPAQTHTPTEALESMTTETPTATVALALPSTPIAKSESMTTETPVATATPEPTPTVTPMPTLTSARGLTQTLDSPTGIATPAFKDTATPQVSWTPAPSPMHTFDVSASTPEMLVLSSDTIARVSLIEVEEHIITGTYSEGTFYRPEIWYEFEVLEYLKGSGSDTIWAIVMLPVDFNSARTSPEDLTRAALSYYLNQRESRWDNQEAIVFLTNFIRDLPSTHPENHYYIGQFFDDIEVYSISAQGKWLPLAPLNGASRASGAGAKDRFLLVHPEGHVFGQEAYRRSYQTFGASGPSRTSDDKTIGLSELREMAAMSEGELGFRAALAGGYAAIPTLTAAATHESVTLNWELHFPEERLLDYVLRAETGYIMLRRAADDGEFESIVNLSADELNYTDTADIAPSTRYTYILRMTTLGDHSVDVRVDVTTADAPTPTAPSASFAAAQNLIATATYDSVTLRWDAPADASALTGYRILRRRQEDSEFARLANIPADATSYADTADIAPAMKYIYRVRALSADGALADARVAITTAAASAP